MNKHQRRKRKSEEVEKRKLEKEKEKSEKKEGGKRKGKGTKKKKVEGGDGEVETSDGCEKKKVDEQVDDKKETTTGVCVVRDRLENVIELNCVKMLIDVD